MTGRKEGDDVLVLQKTECGIDNILQNIPHNKLNMGNIL